MDIDNDLVEHLDHDDAKSVLLEEDIIIKRNLTLEGDLIHNDVQVKNGCLFFNNAKSAKTKSNVVPRIINICYSRLSPTHRHKFRYVF